MQYSKVVAFRSIDSTIAAALFKKIYDVSIELIDDLIPIYDALVVGIPYSNELNISGCMIFVNYFCQEFSVKLPSGNILVCDKSYNTITEMVSDILEVNIPDEVVNFVNSAETMKDKNLAVLTVLLENTEKKIFEEIIEYVNSDSWKKIPGKILSLQEKFSHIVSLAKEKMKELNIIKKQVAYVQYNAANALDCSISKATAIYALENYKTVFAFGCTNEKEVREVFFVSKGKLDKIIPAIEQLGVKILCRKFRGFFRMEWPIRKDRLINILRRV